MRRDRSGRREGGHGPQDGEDRRRGQRLPTTEEIALRHDGAARETGDADDDLGACHGSESSAPGRATCVPPTSDRRVGSRTGPADRGGLRSRIAGAANSSAWGGHRRPCGLPPSRAAVDDDLVVDHRAGRAARNASVDSHGRTTGCLRRRLILERIGARSRGLVAGAVVRHVSGAHVRACAEPTGTEDEQPPHRVESRRLRQHGRHESPGPTARSAASHVAIATPSPGDSPERKR